MEVSQNSQTFRVLWNGLTELTEVAGGHETRCTRTPRVLRLGPYSTHKSSGYGYENLTELPEVPGIVARAYKSYRSSGQA